MQNRPRIIGQFRALTLGTAALLTLGNNAPARQDVVVTVVDLRSADVDFLTIGQYLAPTRRHAPIERFVTPDEFEDFKRLGRAKGFLRVASSPLTRSSYHAGKDFEALQEARRSSLYQGAMRMTHRDRHRSLV